MTGHRSFGEVRAARKPDRMLAADYRCLMKVYGRLLQMVEEVGVELLQVESQVADRLAISLAETEQGISTLARGQMEDWVAAQLQEEEVPL